MAFWWETLRRTLSWKWSITLQNQDKISMNKPTYTKQVMRQPMMTRWGVCFERHAVIQWLEQGQRFCPVTQNAMSPRDLVPNTKLQNQINAFCQTESRHCRSLRARRSRSEDGVLLHGLELAASEKTWRPTAIHVGCLDRYRKASYWTLPLDHLKP